MSGQRWFRTYSAIVDDDKLRLLAFEDRWHFVALCALKSCGLLDEADTPLRTRKVAVKLGVQLRELDEICRRLREVELIDEHMQPRSWDRLQFKGDTSQERVKKYREARKAQGLVAQWQPSKELRQAVYNRDGNTCVYCQSGDDLTLDHKIPEMHGGDNSIDNLQTACRPCNARKRDLTHEEYTARLAGNGHVTLQQRPQRTEPETEVSPNGDCPSSDEPSFTIEQVFEGYQALAKELGLTVPRDLTPERRQLLRARRANYSLEDHLTVFGKCRDSPFLRGDRQGRTPLSFDWLFKKANFQKVLEGNYDG